MLYELKLEFEDKNKLNDLIKKTYFSNELSGRLKKSDKTFLTLDKDSSLYIILKDMNNSTVKIFNNDVMIGNLRMVISETDKNIKLYPCSIYCIVEDGKYSFF